ncbi:MAG: 16S rRNA (guanine(527)-N(7))-methyltransferase RsmG [Pseudomonadota bacterium]
MTDPAAQRQQVIERFGLNAATLESLDAYADLLARWQKKINLVGPSTIQALWQRHIWDSLQLASLLPQGAPSVADLGSGAGLPGLLLAQMRPVTLHSVESDSRKIAFQRQALAQMAFCGKVVLHNKRAEALTPLNADVITARAFAPLQSLLPLGYHHCHETTEWILPKGQNVEAELEEATKCWTFKVKTVHSETHEEARVLCLSEVKPR